MLSLGFKSNDAPLPSQEIRKSQHLACPRWKERSEILRLQLQTFIRLLVGLCYHLTSKKSILISMSFENILTENIRLSLDYRRLCRQEDESRVLVWKKNLFFPQKRVYRLQQSKHSSMARFVSRFGFALNNLESVSLAYETACHQAKTSSVDRFESMRILIVGVCFSDRKPFNQAALESKA